MAFKKLILTAAVLALPLSSYAQDIAPNNTGWFVGGFLGEKTSKIENTFKSTDGSFGVYGGYNFTPWFGLEGSFFIAEDNSVDEPDLKSAGFSGLSITPKFTFAINDTISLYLKAGLATVVYTREYRENDYYGDYTYGDSWSGVGATFGAGAEFKIVNGLKLRVSYDQTKASLDDDDSYYNSEFDVKLSQTALGLHYQF